jgi:YVTN family beta-propeller protein
MKTKLFLLLSAMVLIVSCSSEEKLVDSSIDNWVFLTSQKGVPSISLINQAGQIIKNDVYSENNGKSLVEAPSKIIEFREYLYLLFPNQNKIEVLTKNNYKIYKTIDFTAEGLIPSDMCFPNGTDAYICHGNDTLVSLVDLTNFVIARRIKVGKYPVSITCAGNQIFTTNIGDNTISVIDSRTHKEENVIKVSAAPAFVRPTADEKKVFVVSLGNGKSDTNTTKSPAVITAIDVDSKAILRELELNSAKTTATDQYPIGLAISKTNTAIIMTKSSLLRLDVRNPETVRLVEEKAYKGLVYNFNRDEMIYINSVGGSFQIITGFSASGAKKATISIPAEPSTVHPL